jgi:C4-type Zn-finger protein
MKFRIICPDCGGELCKLVYKQYKRRWWFGPRGHATVSCEKCDHMFIEVSTPSIDRQAEGAVRRLLK